MSDPDGRAAAGDVWNAFLGDLRTTGWVLAGAARCNGHAALCDRALDEVVLPSTHNSMSVPLTGWVSAEQERPIGGQLEDGIRGLLLDTHYQGALMERMAQDGVTVALDGEGGDEVFGADRFLVSDALRAGHPLRALGLVRCYPGAADAPSPRAILYFLTRYGLRGALSPSAHGRLQRPGARSLGPGWMAPWSAGRAAALLDPWRWKDPGKPLWWSHLVHGLTETVDAIGGREFFRHKGMPSGIRIAQPLFDLDLVELVLSLDPEAAYDPHLSRPLLRESMRGWAPEPILRRAGKSRFEPLFVSCFAGADAAVVTGLLGDPAARIRRWTRSELIDEQFARGPQAHPCGARRWADEGFRLVTTEIWLRSLEDPGFPAALRASAGLAELSASFTPAGARATS